MRAMRVFLAALILTCVSAHAGDAQSLKDRLKTKAKAKTDQTAAKTDATTEKAQPAEEKTSPEKATGETASRVQQEKSPTVFVNYDFIPGDRVLYYEDFENDKVGDPPARTKLTSGNVEVADVDGNKVMRATSNATFKVPLPETLPQRFTIEWDESHHPGWPTKVSFSEEDGVAYIGLASDEGYVYTGLNKFAAGPAEDITGKWYRVRLMVDGTKAKLYLNGKRVANAPDINFGRAKFVWFEGTGDENTPAMFDNIRVAESPTTLFDVLMAKGRVATQGILFDTNSDVIRPESMPTLQQIGDMLKQNPQLKILIEGHTDNVGADAANMTLSDKRAAAVRQFLITKQGIDENRLQSKGFGESKPTAPNTTAEGRQQNRRVELVKI